jgi:hypothetical protein
VTRIVTTAGRDPQPQPRTARREALAKIRAAIRDTNARDEDVEDALDALVELAKTED